MNPVQITEFCRLLREYIAAQRADHAAHKFGKVIGFRTCYGLHDDYDPEVYMRMVEMTDAAITARYELRLV